MPKKKTKSSVNILEQLQIRKWPEIPLKRISEVAKALLEDLVRIDVSLYFLFQCTNWFLQHLLWLRNFSQRLLDEAEAFLIPVLDNFPELNDVYVERIAQPMDYRTIEEERLWYYQSISELQADLLLVYYNCMEFNEPDSPLYNTAK